MILQPASTVFAADLRIGMIGLDTSHTVAFAQLLNDPAAPEHVPGAVITSAFRSGSADMPEKSLGRIAGFASALSDGYGVELCETIDEVLARSDAIMIENVDGRKHLEIARAVVPAGKPVFVDKPLGGTVAEGREIIRLAEAHGVPLFSASALRFAPSITRLSPDRRGAVRAAAAFSPCETEPHHPDLFWYGIHGVEMLYALLGAGCESVTRVHAPDGDVVTGRWHDGRLGVFHGHRGGPAHFACKAFMPDGVEGADLSIDYRPLIREIVAFFRTGRAPVSPKEMIEVLAFMEAADESKRRGGVPVSLAAVLAANGGVCG